MSRIFISGSPTGLGLMAADLLVSQGHQVVLHARNADRAEGAWPNYPRPKARRSAMSRGSPERRISLPRSTRWGASTP